MKSQRKSLEISALHF